MKSIKVMKDGSQLQFLAAGVKEIRVGTLGITSSETAYLKLAEGENEISFDLGDFSLRIVIKDGKPQGISLVPFGEANLRIPPTDKFVEPEKKLFNPNLDIFVHNILRASNKPLTVTEICEKIGTTFNAQRSDKEAFNRFVVRVHSYLKRQVNKGKIVREDKVYSLPTLKQMRD